MRKMVMHVLLVLLLISLVLVLPAAAAVNGKIAFVSNRDGNKEIYVMNADGTDQKNLTKNIADDSNPVWSPDGTKIAFVSKRDGNNEIYVMNGDGTDQTRLTTNASDDVYPLWSPDSTKIVFVSKRDGNNEIYVMNADGTSQTRLTTAGGLYPEWSGGSNPAWSPDGTKIAFSSMRGNDVDLQIYVMNADGSKQIRLTNSIGMHFNPKWSPDGTKIAFDIFAGGNQISVINADGTYADTFLFDHPNLYPAWSPDGTKLAFQWWARMAPNTEGICVINAVGTGNGIMLDNHETDPLWSPDGTKIVFVRDNEIYVMNPDGTSQTRLTNNLADDSEPDWGPAITPITITSPNGGESWQRATPHTVTWSYTGNPGTTVKIVLLKAGTEVGTIANSVSIGSGGKGSYTWPVYPTGSTGSDYKVSVQSISQPTIKDTSNNYFIITPPPTPSSITVTTPNGGESWQRGTLHTVTWSYTGSPGSLVKIVLLKAGTEVGTATYSTSIGANGEGSYTWVISSGRAPDKDYQILVQSVSQPTIKDTSNSYFTITSGTPVPIPSITVTSPNGGEPWQRGTSHTVAWDYTGTPGSMVKIELLKGGTPVGTATSSTSIGSNGKGSYTWTISSTRAAGSDYRIRATSVNQPTISDTSNGDFTITSATLSSITVTSPNGGESWKRGTCYPVTWSYTGSPGSYVKVVLVKGSSEVGTASASTPIGSSGIGSYTWCISSTRAAGNDYKMSVQSLSQPTVRDVSNSIFTITI